MQLIVPARNEESRLPSTLVTLREQVMEDRAAGLAPCDVEVIVVDNASTDRTGELALAASTPELPVRVTRCATLGKGAAVRHGIALTTHDVVGFMDADGATELTALRAASALLADGSDIAIGSRAVTGSKTLARHSKVREHGAALFRSLAGHLVPGVRDTQCGFKLMRGDVARQVFAEVRTDGFSFDVELLARAIESGASIAEFPVVWVDVPGSTFVPARHGAAAFWELAQIRWLLRRPLTSHATPAAEPSLADGLPTLSGLPPLVAEV